MGASTLSGEPFRPTCTAASTARPEVFGPPTWYTLHALAQQFPDSPTPSQAQACGGFVGALPYMLPNGDAGATLQRFSVDYPGGAEGACRSGPGLRQFLCSAHNHVNLKLGKPALNCAPAVLEAMYRTAPACAS